MSKTGINKRNGDIDFLRFFFAIGIVIFHFGITFHKTGFSNGYIGVEFFFIVTGYLMAMHANNLNQKRESITGVGNETWIFIINKIKQFYKYYICVILIQIFVIDLLIHRISFGAILTMVLKGIPNYLLVYMGLNFGSEGFSITGMWYLSSMIIALFLLYITFYYKHLL